MGKIALVFSGQGAQHTGMGRDFWEKSPAARDIFERLDAVRPGTSAQCFGASDEELSITTNTQPCLFAMEAAAAAALCEAGIKADMAAGFSLGELSALCYAGALDPETMLGLVIKRADFMQEAGEKHPASMAAVLKLPPEKVEEICAGFGSVYPVNFNCPGQISVSGLSGQMPAFIDAVRKAGGRAVPLKVKGGFHSPFLKEASELFRHELGVSGLSAARIPVYANYNALPYPDGISAQDILAKQICSPVRWETTIRNMIGAGADIFIEAGPGETLSGMIKRISGGVRIYPVSDIAGIEKIKTELDIN